MHAPGQADNPAFKPSLLAQLESLESRRLLATIDVTAFGALPGDGVDDANQIQRAINASAPGDTILFPAGTYNVSKAFDPKGGGRILQGNGAAIQTTGSTNPAIHFQGKGLTITGFTFKGRGIFLDNNLGNMVEDLVIDQNHFMLQASGIHNDAIEFTTGLRNTKITNNYFDPIHGDNGVYGYYWDNLTIANNSFTDGNEGIHIIDHSNSSKNLLIEQNYFSGLHRMGIEYQGGGWNTVVQDNYYENPVLFGSVSQNLDVFAYSIVADRSHNTVVRRNYAKGTERPDGFGVREMYELGGTDLDMYDNYSEGGYNVIAVNGTNATGNAHDNKILNYLTPPYNANGAHVQFSNNGPNVQLTWDINRPKPGPNFRVEGGGDLPPQVDVPTGVNAPSELKATAVGSSRVDLTWKDNSDNEIGFKLERSFDNKTWTQVALLKADRTSYSNTGLPVGRKVYYRIRSYNALANSDYSNTAQVTTGTTGGTTTKPPGVVTKPPTGTTTGGSTGTVTSTVIGGTSASTTLPNRGTLGSIAL